MSLVVASLVSLVEVDKKISSVQDKAAVFGDAIGKRSLVQGKVTELDGASRMRADTEHGPASIPKQLPHWTWTCFRLVAR